MTKQTQNIILTGPPRSGTTLTCHLLNKAANTVALHEPMNLKMFPDRVGGLKNIADFFGEMRASLLKDGTAIAKVKEGKIPDNPFETKSEGVRHSTVQKGTVHFDKELSADFNLVIKQNAHFTFLLEELLPDYPCFSIIRNPLSTIASWNSITAPVSKGNLTVLKGIDPALHAYLENIPNLIDRQVFLIHKHFEPYANLATGNIIKYEDVIRTGGSALSAIVPEARSLKEPLESKNQNKVYDTALMEEIAEKLLAQKEGAYFKYYSDWDIEYNLGRMLQR